MLPLASISQTITDGVAGHGVLAVFVLMAVDALLPVGGELIMLVAGAIAAGAVTSHSMLFGHELAAGGQAYVVLAVAGTLGYLAGSLVGWRLGASIGADFLVRYGRIFHLGPRNVTRAQHWFTKHGPSAVLLGRLTPLVRSFISIPAGIFGEPLARYTLLTLLGSAIWCFAFAGLGWALGASYESVDRVTRPVELAIVATLAVGAVVLWRRTRNPRHP